MSCLICLTPFLWQRLNQHPDVSRRLGQFATPRFPPLFEDFHLPESAAYLPLLLGVLLWATPLGQRTMAHGSVAACVHNANRIGWVHCTLPISCMFLGKTIALEQFVHQFHVLSGFLMVFGLALLGERLFTAGSQWLQKGCGFGGLSFEGTTALAGLGAAAWLLIVFNLRPPYWKEHRTGHRHRKGH